ncbi:MAG: acyloxyacyl hydrolase [Magnetovibrio sp.]|nr:acyloxyacyl hydrolase [Magnetovibrio sp.]
MTTHPGADLKHSFCKNLKVQFLSLGLFFYAGVAFAQGAQLPADGGSQFWQLVRAQDPYFNKSGSILPQRYTRAQAPAVRPAPGQPTYKQQPMPYMQLSQDASQPLSQFPSHYSSASTQAQAANDDALWGYISELRFGLLSHDVRFPSRHEFHAPNPFENRYESGINLNPEVVFTSPEWLDWFWEPRPHVGVSVNTSGDTSSIYTGIGWDTAWDNGIFLDGFWGLAAHDGEKREGNDKGKIEFGSTVLFRLGGEVGWRWDDNHGVGVLWEHMSNGGMFSSKNQGIDSLGLRYSYRFDAPN